MTFSVYDVVVPGMSHGLSVLESYLDQAEALEKQQGTGLNVLGARLAPDMLSFGEQISVAANKTERHLGFLIGEDPVTPPDTEQTYSALRVRLAGVRTFLQSLTFDQFVGAESRTYRLTPEIVRGWFGGSDYIFYLVIPDFYFHVVTAHAILRHLGAPIGKRDYLGWLNMEHPEGYS